MPAVYLAPTSSPTTQRTLLVVLSTYLRRVWERDYISDNAILRFNGTSNFTNNLAIYGGTIYSFNKIVLSFNGTINFISNSAVLKLR